MSFLLTFLFSFYFFFFADVDREICEQMRMLVPLNLEIDSTHFRIFRTNGSYLRELPPVDRYKERIRFFHVGECVRLMYNTIRLSGEHDELNYLMRKTFLRMRYILFESFSEQFAGNNQALDLKQKDMSYDTIDMAEQDATALSGDNGVVVEEPISSEVDTSTEVVDDFVVVPAPAATSEEKVNAPEIMEPSSTSAADALYGKKKKKKPKKKKGGYKA